MLYRKIDFTFWGVTLFKRALKCITLNKMKERLVHYGHNALMFASTKKQVSTTYFECIIRKLQKRFWALSHALHLRSEKYLLGWQGNMVSHYI